MSEVTVQVNDKVSITAGGETPMDIFKSISRLQEVFDNPRCGKCKNTNLQFVVRTAKDGADVYEYPELRCGNLKCKAKLTFGQKKGGDLFPIRYKRDGKKYVLDADGNHIKKGSYGWVIYNHETGEEE